MTDVPSAAPTASKTEALLPRSALGRGFALLAGATGIGGIIAATASLILSHLYTPQDMGKMGTFTALTSILAVGVSLRYEAAIVSTRSRSEGAILVVACLALMVPLSAGGAMALYGAIAHGWFGLGALPRYAAMLAIPATLLPAAVTLALLQESIRCTTPVFLTRERARMLG